MTSVRVVAVTQPVLPELFTPEDVIVFQARVSNPENQFNTDTGGKLLDYCKRKKHWSVFEMASATLEIKTTRDISRQILRHRSFSFQEWSQRYAACEVLNERREVRLQDLTNRQSSLPTDDPKIHEWWDEAQTELAVTAAKLYNDALSLGIAKEVARTLLPEGLTPTTLYMHGTVRSWLHYVELRTAPETQKEHREVAELCGKALMAYFPQVFGAT
jgi:thymidylate synthase (FAD)